MKEIERVDVPFVLGHIVVGLEMEGVALVEWLERDTGVHLRDMCFSVGADGTVFWRSIAPLVAVVVKVEMSSAVVEMADEYTTWERTWYSSRP